MKRASASGNTKASSAKAQKVSIFSTATQASTFSFGFGLSSENSGDQGGGPEEGEEREEDIIMLQGTAKPTETVVAIEHEDAFTGVRPPFIYGTPPSSFSHNFFMYSTIQLCSTEKMPSGYSGCNTVGYLYLDRFDLPRC